MSGKSERDAGSIVALPVKAPDIRVTRPMGCRALACGRRARPSHRRDAGGGAVAHGRGCAQQHVGERRPARLSQRGHAAVPRYFPSFPEILDCWHALHAAGLAPRLAGSTKRMKQCDSAPAPHSCSSSRLAPRRHRVQERERPGTRRSPTSSERRRCRGLTRGGALAVRRPSLGLCWRSGALPPSTMTGSGSTTGREGVPLPLRVRSSWELAFVYWLLPRSSRAR